MKFKVFILRSAKEDLKSLKHYLIEKFSAQTWKESYKEITKALDTLKSFPELGSIPNELTHSPVKHYRQIICGMNRIFYKVRDNTVYIHLICDARRDFKVLLLKRMLK